MKTQLTIGKKSDNAPVNLAMEDLPHLFVSWSEQSHWLQLLRELLNQLLIQFNAGCIELAICSRSSAFLPDTRFLETLTASLLRDPKTGLTGSRLEFLLILRNKFRNRLKNIKKGHRINTLELKPLIVLIDDLIDLVITRNKKTGILFLELMRQGPEAKIHFILGSTRSYQGLAKQLLQFDKQKETSLVDNYLPELVLSPEGLLFYKCPTELNYTRLFSLREGEK